MLRKSGIEDAAFFISKHIKPSVEPVLTGLRTVFLDIGSSFGDSGIVQVNQTPFECRHYDLMEFLSKLSQIEHLRLNFRSPQADANSVLKWLAQKVTATITPSKDNDGPNVSTGGSPSRVDGGSSPQLAQNVSNNTPESKDNEVLTLPQPITMPHLRHLELGMITTDAKTILSVIRKFSPSLQAISLHRVTLLVPP
jgi:hypothetical protein